jgi:hypothetical protein
VSISYNAHDPIVQAFEQLTRRVGDCEMLLGHLNSWESTNQLNIAKLQGQLDAGYFKLEELLPKTTDDSVALAHLLGDFHELEPLVTSIDNVLEQVIPLLQDVNGGQQLSELQAKIQDEFSLLRKLIIGVTPAHLALQRHFELMTLVRRFAGLRRFYVQEKLFDGTAKLRDRYFAKPEVTTLVGYQASAKKLVNSRAYRRYCADGFDRLYSGLTSTSTDSFRKELEGHADELEVWVMLAVLDEPVPLSKELSHDA